MTKAKRVTGSGITKHEQVRYSDDDVDSGIQEVFSGLSGRDTIANIEHHMWRILETAGITTDMEAHHVGEVESDLLRKYETPEWYAVEVLRHLDWMQKNADRGDHRAAFCRAMEAGMLFQEAAMKVFWEPSAMRGQTTLNATSKGGKENSKKHGFKHRASELQAAVDRKHEERPDLSYKRLQQLVAVEFGISETTVKRYTSNPKK